MLHFLAGPTYVREHILPPRETPNPAPLLILCPTRATAGLPATLTGALPEHTSNQPSLRSTCTPPVQAPALHSSRAASHPLPQPSGPCNHLPCSSECPSRAQASLPGAAKGKAAPEKRRPPRGPSLLQGTLKAMTQLTDFLPEIWFSLVTKYVRSILDYPVFAGEVREFVRRGDGGKGKRGKELFLKRGRTLIVFLNFFIQELWLSTLAKY